MEVNPLANKVKAADIAPERLANNSALTEEQKIAEASRQFEAILLRQILSSTQKPLIPSKFADNSTASSIYRDMVTNQLADNISKSGAFGLARTFEQQLTHRSKAKVDDKQASPEALTAERRTNGSTTGPQGAPATFLKHRTQSLRPFPDSSSPT